MVITEDGISNILDKRPRKVLNQWTYQARMYQAARYVHWFKTTDEMRDILEGGGKLYPQLKIDDISNLGAVRIRIRSLIAAMEAQKERAKNGKGEM